MVRIAANLISKDPVICTGLNVLRSHQITILLLFGLAKCWTGAVYTKYTQKYNHPNSAYFFMLDLILEIYFRVQLLTLGYSYTLLVYD